MRPQATFVAESAKNRESVMSLGSIAHLQYYFARTGLLDGKGAQFAKDDPQRRKSSAPVTPTTSGMPISGASRAVSMGLLDTSSGAFLSASPVESCAVSDEGFTDSPIDQEEDPDWEDGDIMLPPTVSTYNQRPIWVQPPPDLTMLRRELTEALEDALKVLKETDKNPDGMYLHLLQKKSMLIINGRCRRLVRNSRPPPTRHNDSSNSRRQKLLHSSYPPSTTLLHKIRTRNPRRTLPSPGHSQAHGRP